MSMQAALPLPLIVATAYEQHMTADPISERLIAEVAGHRLEVIPDGQDRLTRLVRLIDGAEQRIDLIFYMFSADQAGQMIRAALTRAAERGVRVRAVIDSFGSSETPDNFFAPLRAKGGTITFFSRRWRSSYLIRNHQKMIIIDRQDVMMGGFNINDGYLSAPGPDMWFDLGVVISGASVDKLVAWFEAIHDYTVHHDGKLLMLRRLIRQWPVTPGPFSWLVGGPTQRLSPWARTVRRDFLGAKRLDMVMAYFSPAQGMLRRIGRIARTGTVRLIMAAKSDNGATIGASRLLYGYLLRKGAKIWEYQPRRLHMKLIIIDDIVYLGSANFDMRSLFLNVEISLRIEDAGFADQMRAFLDRQQGDCALITREIHKQRANWLTRLRWGLAWLVVGLVDYTVARRLNFGLGKMPSDDQ